MLTSLPLLSAPPAGDNDTTLFVVIAVVAVALLVSLSFLGKKK